MLLQPRYVNILTATRGGHAELVALLLTQKTEQSPTSLLGLKRHIFLEASYYGHEAIVRMVLKAGVDVNRRMAKHPTKPGCFPAL
jgi:hypothetical protein